MAQTTILASGATRASTASTAVASGAIATVGLFATGGIKPGMRAVVYIDTPGADNVETELDHTKKQTQVQGPCSYIVERVEGEFGVYQDA